MKIVHAKLVVMGPHAVGKSSVITRYETNTFSQGTTCTIGASFSNFEETYEDTKIKMQVWDTAGQERFRSMAPLYYRGANAALLVFDITDVESLSLLHDWATELLNAVDRKRIVLAVAGNKSDRDSERAVLAKEGRAFAEEIQARYFETSALNSTGIKEVFQYFFDEICHRLKFDNPCNGIMQMSDQKEATINLSSKNDEDHQSPNNCCNKR